MALSRREFLGRAAMLAGLAPTVARAAAPSAPEVQPAALAMRLKRGERPLIVQVGFAVLYRAAHIPGAIYAGPASRAEGLAALRRQLSAEPRSRTLVLYCGCCPWTKCPNIRPAARVARSLGFRHVEVLYLRDSFAADWVHAGYPAAGRDFPRQKRG